MSEITGWQDVHAEVLRRIQSLEWAPGDQIPNESDLAREFGCARATVNRALQSLADAGLVERRRRAGTRVTALPVGHARLRIPILREEIEAQGMHYGYQLILSEKKRPPKALGSLFGDIDQDLLHVIAVHHADSAPYIHEDRWISLTVIPSAADANFERISANEWLVTNVPISSGEIVFKALIADAMTAKLLACQPGTALLSAERSTSYEGRPLTFVRQTFHPGYRLSMRV